MLDQLNRYSINGHFIFKKDEVLAQLCTAPDAKSGIFISGVYIVYALSKQKIEIVYIGRSGKKDKEGNIQNRKAGCGGIRDRIINGKDSKIPRKISWPYKMQYENIDALDIHWYVTHDAKYKDCPDKIEKELLMKFREIYKKCPRWNRM